jgi:phosphoribosylanthranilate isomerase
VRIKICGITRRDDAECALAMGADAIGCVFYPGSRRAVSLEVAADISRGVSGLGMMVGLFVDQSAEDVHSILERVPLHALQFHGGESEAFCRQFNRPYIKAIPMSGDVNLADEHLAYASATGLLLDSVHAGQFGGSGQCFDWSWVTPDLSPRVILAGGLSSKNVAAAIAQVRPAAVDVSSGVEKEVGVKDVAKMKAFIEAARSAAQDISS